MLTMNEFVDLRMQQQIAHEIYRQQIMQRIPDPFPPMLPLPMPHHIIMPPRPTLPGVEAKLENNDLWKQFHKIGTEMIITKSGRRMFPSMRISLAGLDEESNYCVLLEMVPIGDCRYKFSGSQWVPAGGAEPQSPQRMFLHADSPATGAHWQAQAILFNKVKLTNNTLDSNGHIVLASMHKYQPRLHVIRTSDLTQLPWAPQQAFVFPETEFVAVTAYQNDRITKLKIDNNPFAKGFRETGQSRCKRKLSALNDEHSEQNDQLSLVSSPNKSSSSMHNAEDDRCSSIGSADISATQSVKRFRSNGSIDDDACSSSGTISPGFNETTVNNIYNHHQLQHLNVATPSSLQFYQQHSHQIQHQHQQQHQQQHQHHSHHHHPQQQQQQQFQEQQHHLAALQLHAQPTAMDLAAAAYFSQTLIMDPQHLAQLPLRQHLPTMPSAFYAASPPEIRHANMVRHNSSIELNSLTPPPTHLIRADSSISSTSLPPSPSPMPASSPLVIIGESANTLAETTTETETETQTATTEASVSASTETNSTTTTPAADGTQQPTQTKRNSFSISAILAY